MQKVGYWQSRVGLFCFEVLGIQGFFSLLFLQYSFGYMIILCCKESCEMLFQVFFLVFIYFYCGRSGEWILGDKGNFCFIIYIMVCFVFGIRGIIFNVIFRMDNFFE